MKISPKRQKELERLLRKARQEVFNNDRYVKIIDKCKARLEDNWRDSWNKHVEHQNRWRWL